MDQMDTTRYRILLVDDEPGVLKITGTLLSAHFPNELIMTTSPEEALQIVSKEDIAVVLSDLYMPRVNGSQVLQEAHRVNPDCVGILVTARATKEVIIDGMNKGYLWKCLEKPWITADLVALTKDALERYASTVKPAVADSSSMMSEQTDEDSSNRRRIVIQKSDLRLSRKQKPSVHLKLKGKSIVFGKGSAAKTAGLNQSRYISSFSSDARMRLLNIKLRRKVAEANEEEVEKAIDFSVTNLVDNRYLIEELLKEGGSGIIYKAHDKLLDMPVAIKVLSDELTDDRDAMRELLDEARFAMQLSHKHIVRLHTINETGGRYYLVMEYIEGLTLREIMQSEQQMDLLTIAQIAEVMGDALGYAHRHGIYHRDLKPDNVMITDDGVLRIIDFGLACLAQQVRQHQDICGTPFYMSPEEINGEELDGRADIYALGVLLHELLTGKLPFGDGGDSPPEDFLHYVPVCSQELPEELRAVLQRAMATDRKLRWSDVSLFADVFCSVCRKFANDT